MNILNQSEIKFITDLALNAGSIAISYFQKPHLKIKSKNDKSLVSEADIKVSDFISKGLKSNFPNIKIVCEEGDNRDIGDLFWLIDPIDGTNEFINGGKEFTVNIALIKDQKPAFGIIYAPAFPESPLYYLNHQNHVLKYLPKLNQEIQLKKKKSSNMECNIITSQKTKDEDLRNYIDKFVHPKEVKITRLSSSLKFCYLLDNKADIYLHFRKSMEWDTAAGHALIKAIGEEIFDFNNKELLYGKPDFANQAFIAS